MDGIFQGYRSDVKDDVRDQAAINAAKFTSARVAELVGRTPDAYTATGMPCFGGFSGGQYQAADGSWPKERLISAVDGTEVNTLGAAGSSWLPGQLACDLPEARPARRSAQVFEMEFELAELIAGGFLDEYDAEQYRVGNTKRSRAPYIAALAARDAAKAAAAQAAKHAAFRAASNPFAALAALKA